jgi:uncharacterized membrane protein YfcA
MRPMNESHLLGVFVVFVLAGGVKGITGMGLPTVAMSLLGLWMAPAQAAALLVLPTLSTNVAQCIGPQFRRLLALLWPAWGALAVVTVWGPDVGHALPGVPAHKLLGAVLVVYGLWGLWGRVQPDWSRTPVALGALAGAATGLVTAATAVFAIPLVPYLQALRLERQAMVQALGLSFTVATVALAFRLRLAEVPLLSAPSAVSLVAAFVGLGAGAALRNRFSALAFQRSLYIVLVGLGVANLLRAG